MPILSDTQIVRTLRPIRKSSTVWPWSTLSLSLSTSCKSHLPLIRIFGIILYLHEIPLAETIGVKKKVYVGSIHSPSCRHWPFTFSIKQSHHRRRGGSILGPERVPGARFGGDTFRVGI